MDTNSSRLQDHSTKRPSDSQPIGNGVEQRSRLSATEILDSFHYKPLDRSAGAVRLIKIFPPCRNGLVRCRIERHHISTVRYVAVSYVWGAEDANCKILLNGRVLKVRPNLLAFLRHIARTGYFTDTLFWIDAICINQEDAFEKNHQVSHMGAIYSQASKAISWLGNGSSHRCLGLDPPGPWICCGNFLHDQNATIPHRCGWQVPNNSSWNFLRHEYWGRLWVAQELGLARQVDVLWKGRFYSWSRIKDALWENVKSIRETQSRPAPGWKCLEDNVRYLHGLPVARYLKSARSAPLGTLVSQFLSHECRVGHDHAFALLSMASDGDKFEPDYNESHISLMLRLMNFCYKSPTATFTAKVGSALGLDPEVAGVPVEFTGHPNPCGTVGDALTFFRLADVIQGDIESTDLLIQLPDTHLFILFRKNGIESSQHVYSPLARVNAVSIRVEQAKKRFASKRRAQTTPSLRSMALFEFPAWSSVTLQKNSSTNRFNLYGNWKAMLSIFEYSSTMSARGRLESRVREWIYPSGTTTEQFQTFLISKESKV